MSFRITGLPAEDFAHLFALSDEELVALVAARRSADARTPGYPCGVSLTDSRPGDEFLLVNYEHHPVSSPYRMRFAVYVARARRPMTRSARCRSSCGSARLRCAPSMPMR